MIAWAQTSSASSKTTHPHPLIAPVNSLNPALAPNARLIFLGSGSSSGTPFPACIFPEGKMDPRCKVSYKALEGEPHTNVNYRCNPSLLIHTPANKFIQIDVGKTFREAFTRWYPRFGVSSLDAVILTHSHADAILGLDDIRGLQKYGVDTPVFLTTDTFETVRKAFSYLTDTPTPVPGAPVVVRSIARLSWKMIEPWKSFQACDLDVIPIPVMHGEDYVSMGFEFGKAQRIVYISDVSRFPDEAEQHLLRSPIDLLVLDCLFQERRHDTHFNLPQAIEFTKRVRPRQTLLIGMSGEIDHEQLSDHLAKLKETDDLSIGVSHDGMCLHVTL